MEATNEQMQKVISALKAAVETTQPERPDAIEEYRAAIYNALYELACKGVIPPEIKLDVTIVAVPERRPVPNLVQFHGATGSWAVQFSDDFNAWMSDLDNR